LVEIIKEALQGTRDVAQRMVNAEERFLSYAQEFGNLTREQAIKALEAYRKAKVIKIDPIGGGFTFKNGAFADKEVLRRAAGLDEK